MPCQVQVLLYGPATYRSDVLPELPPTNRTDALVGRLRTPLRWAEKGTDLFLAIPMTD